MPFRLHSTLIKVSSIVGAIIGLLSGFIVAIYFIDWIEKVLKISPGLSSLAGGIVFFTFFIAGTFIPVYFYKNFIPTRCPMCKSKDVVCDLGFNVDNQITYHCKSCKYSHKTGIYLGDR
jgi:hypothetical protein